MNLYGKKLSINKVEVDSASYCTNGAVSNQLTDVKGGKSLLGGTVTLLLCDRDIHCTLYTPQSNVFCVDLSPLKLDVQVRRYL
jgi:hypothetical protein